MKAITCILVIVILILPNVIFKIQDKTIDNMKYEVQERQTKLNVEVEDIYLVKAIHKGYYDIAITDVNTMQTKTISEYKNGNVEYGKFVQDIEKELYKLKSDNVITLEILSNQDEKIEVGLLTKRYLDKKTEYSMDCINITAGNTYINIQMENKTKKLLYIEFGSKNNEDKFFGDISKEEILRNYVKYLDLYIIDDWTYENETLKSEKASLVVTLKQNEQSYELSINPQNSEYKVII